MELNICKHQCIILCLQEFHYWLTRPFTTQPITTFADLSSRNARAGQGRCFARASICKFHAPVHPEIVNASQSVAEFYEDRLPPRLMDWDDDPTTLKVGCRTHQRTVRLVWAAMTGFQ